MNGTRRLLPANDLCREPPAAEANEPTRNDPSPREERRRKHLHLALGERERAAAPSRIPSAVRRNPRPDVPTYLRADL